MLRSASSWFAEIEMSSGEIGMSLYMCRVKKKDVVDMIYPPELSGCSWLCKQLAIVGVAKTQVYDQFMQTSRNLIIPVASRCHY